MSVVLVTGGAGFIGSNLCDRLLEMGHRVVNIDNLCDFYSPEVKRGNIAETVALARESGNEGNYSFEQGDIRDKDFLDRVFTEYKPDVVVHLAAMAGVRPSIDNPQLYTEVNLNGTVNILECIKKQGIKRLVFASSSSVYGNNEKAPFSERDAVDNPISPYAATKKSGELLCHTYHHLYNINMACLRFFTVYGPRQRPDLAIHKFTDYITHDKPIPVFGNGETERDYTFIKDIIDGVVKSMEWTDSEEKRFEVFNLGESCTVKLSRMIESIENALGKKAIINRLPEQPGDVQRTWADVSKAKEILGYAPSTDFDEGIREFVKWYLNK